MRYALILTLLAPLVLVGCDSGGEDPTPFSPEGTWVGVAPIAVDTTLADGTHITATGSHAVSLTVEEGGQADYHITQAGTVSIRSPDGAARGGINLGLDATVPGFVSASSAGLRFAPVGAPVSFEALLFLRVADNAVRGNTVILFEGTEELEQVPIDVPLTLRR